MVNRLSFLTLLMPFCSMRSAPVNISPTLKVALGQPWKSSRSVTRVRTFTPQARPFCTGHYRVSQCPCCSGRVAGWVTHEVK